MSLYCTFETFLSNLVMQKNSVCLIQSYCDHTKDTLLVQVYKLNVLIAKNNTDMNIDLNSRQWSKYD